MGSIVLILGAGASAPFFEPPLCTDTLTEAVKDKELWENLIRRYKEVARSTNPIEEQAIFDLLEELELVCDFNFEDIVEIVDKTTSYSLDSSNSKIYHALINLHQGRCRNNYPEHTWDVVPFLFRQLISEKIELFQEERRHSNYDESIAVFNKFLGFLSSHSKLSVFSFNYDDVLFDALKIRNHSLADGFHDTGYFNPSSFFKSESVVAFPHGHARFVCDDNGVCLKRLISNANKTRFKNLYNITHEQTKYIIDAPNCYSFNSFIITGRDKETSFNQNPFASYYQRMAADLLAAKLVIIAGYSFQDPHISRLLFNYRKLNPDNQILIVDLREQDLEVIGGFANTDSLIGRILRELDVSGIPLKQFSLEHPLEYQLEYRNQQDIDQLNRNGYGKLFHQINFYKKGFLCFLQSPKSILKNLNLL